jgi:hypothetical protein
LYPSAVTAAHLYQNCSCLKFFQNGSPFEANYISLRSSFRCCPAADDSPLLNEDDSRHGDGWQWVPLWRHQVWQWSRFKPIWLGASHDSKAGDTLSSCHVSSRDVTSAAGIFNIEFWCTLTLLSLCLRHVIWRGALVGSHASTLLKFLLSHTFRETWRTSRLTKCVGCLQTRNVCGTLVIKSVFSRKHGIMKSVLSGWKEKFDTFCKM